MMQPKGRGVRVGVGGWGGVGLVDWMYNNVLAVRVNEGLRFKIAVFMCVFMRAVGSLATRGTLTLSRILQ